MLKVIWITPPTKSHATKITSPRVFVFLNWKLEAQEVPVTSQGQLLRGICKLVKPSCLDLEQFSLQNNSGIHRYRSKKKKKTKNAIIFQANTFN